jgi:hypothetical protein
VLRALGGQEATGNGAAETDGVVADVDVLLHLADAFGLDLADLEGDELAEIASLGTERVADLTHQFATHRHRHGAKLDLRRTGRAHHFGVLGERGAFHACDWCVGGWIHAQQFSTTAMPRCAIEYTWKCSI